MRAVLILKSFAGKISSWDVIFRQNRLRNLVSQGKERFYVRFTRSDSSLLSHSGRPPHKAKTDDRHEFHVLLVFAFVLSVDKEACNSVRNLCSPSLFLSSSFEVYSRKSILLHFHRTSHQSLQFSTEDSRWTSITFACRPARLHKENKEITQGRCSTSLDWFTNQWHVFLTSALLVKLLITKTKVYFFPLWIVFTQTGQSFIFAFLQLNGYVQSSDTHFTVFVSTLELHESSLSLW